MPEISRYTLITALCGILSGGGFSLVAYNSGGGVLVLFLPVLPLAALGLALGVKYCLQASVVACVIIMLALNAEYMVFFLLFIGFPLLHFIRRVLLWRGEEGARTWYPILPALAEVTAITAAVFMFLSMMVAYSEHADLQTLFSQTMSGELHEQMGASDPQVAHFMKMLTHDWGFLVFAFASWLWVLLIYAFVVLANGLLGANGITPLRPSLALSLDHLPLWLPFIVLVSAALAFFGHGNDKFAGEAVFLIMLLPYLLSGIAHVHKISAQWQHKKLVLAFFYIALLFFPWMFVLLVASGLYTQVETLLKNTANH